MLFAALKGLFFLEQRFKATMVGLGRLSSTGHPGAFCGATQNRTESQPQPWAGPALRGREGPVWCWGDLASLGRGELWHGAKQRGSGILQGMLRSIISWPKRELPLQEPLKAPCAPEISEMPFPVRSCLSRCLSLTLIIWGTESLR